MFMHPTLLSARLDVRRSSKRAQAVYHAHYGQTTNFSAPHVQQPLQQHVQALVLFFLPDADDIT